VKLSANERQRWLRILAILIGGAAVLYACLNLLILPLLHGRIAGMNKLAELSERIETAKMDPRDLAASKAELARLQAELLVATNQFVLRPVLGSMLVSVQNIIEPIAATCGLQIEACLERGRSELPVSRKNATLTIDRYLMEISALGSYAAIRDFIQTVEQTNPYVCVSDLEITGRSDNSDRHKARICLEWPVFGAPNEAEPVPAPVRGTGIGGKP